MSDDIDNLFGPIDRPAPVGELEPFSLEDDWVEPDYEEEAQALLHDAGAIKDLMRKDLNVFGSVVAPEQVIYTFPDFYTFLFLKIITALNGVRDFSKFAIGLPRGHAKTFVIKLILVYTILFTKKKYILVIAATLPKAENIIADVFDMLMSENISKLFGDVTRTIEKNTQNLKRFAFNGRYVILEAAGQGTAIRGSNQKLVRPDVILFDDAQTRESAKSIVESKEYHSWFSGDAMKAKSQLGCTFIYIGNMYKDLEIEPGSGIHCCMLRNLARDPNWLSMIVGAILQDGTALWEELVPIDQLLAEYESDKLLGQEAVFMAEVLNDPRGVPANGFNPAKVVAFEITPDLIHQGNFIVIDPSTSKATPDQTVIGYHEIYDDKVVLVEMIVGKFTGPEQAHQAISLALKHQCTLIVPESVAYQHTLGEWIQYTAEQRGVFGIVVEPSAHRGQSKNSVILRWLESVMKGEYWFTAATKSLGVAQALLFDPTKTNNVDDIIDMGAMAMNVALTKRHLMHIQHYAGDYSDVLPESVDCPYPF